MSYSGWIYFLGEQTGADIKIGYSGDEAPSVRVASVNGEQMDESHYVLLAAVRGTRTQEGEVKRYFADIRRPRGRRTEYFWPRPALSEYVNWLRQQWWVTLTVDEPLDDVVGWNHTRPMPDRRVRAPTDDPDLLVQVNRSFHGDLAGTAWDWMSTPEPIGEDYYTPPEIVEAARQAMGGIDLDPASHWRANREHKVTTYYTIHRSAFHNPWFGRVWLNPPYGDNAPWFDAMLKYEGAIEQLCMISPVWVFIAAQARPIMARVSASVLLSPTPSFWGHPSGRTGTNHPHMVVYMGDNPTAFIEAFRPYGIAIRVLDEALAGVS